MEREIPSTDKTTFECPHCGAYTNHIWQSVRACPLAEIETPFIARNAGDDEDNIRATANYFNLKPDSIERIIEQIKSGKPYINKIICQDDSKMYPMGNIWFSLCAKCEYVSVWVHDTLIYPISSFTPIPNPKLSTDVLKDYQEAAAILPFSPRSSAALLRLVIEKMCKEINVSGNNLNEQIANLVENGLNVKTQKALDTVRIYGNNAVHPGCIDVLDDTATVKKLFDLVNMIADDFAQQRIIHEVYETIPNTLKDSIKRRDKKRS